MIFKKKEPEKFVVTTIYIGGKIAMEEAETIPSENSFRPYWWWPILGLVFAFAMMVEI